MSAPGPKVSLPGGVEQGTDRALAVSVIVPCYNERESVIGTLQRVQESLATFGQTQVIVVDDGSTDGSGDLLDRSAEFFTILVRHERNVGKGAAIRTGLKHAQGEVVLIQDADSEYWPEDYPQLVEPILKGEADAVYGRRVTRDPRARRALAYSGSVRFFSWLVRLLSRLPVRDVATCYKAFRREILQEVDCLERGFSWDVEVTLKIARQRHVRFREVEIRYSPRTHAEGKKLRWWHGIRYLWTILRHGVPTWLQRTRSRAR